MKKSKLVVMGAGLVAACGLLVGPVAFADMEGSPQAKFKKMDVNGDGSISRDEYTSFTTVKFQKMDSNGDGYVTATELDAVYEPGEKGAAKPMSSADKLKKDDKNGDGKLSADEHATAKRSMFEEIDSDGNGSLSMTEYTSGMRKTK